MIKSHPVQHLAVTLVFDAGANLLDITKLFMKPDGQMDA